MAYLAGAYLAIWAILFGYIFSLHRRTKQLERDLDALGLEQEQEG